MKKFVSKFLSVALALALILSMSVAVFAATVTVNGYLHTVTKKTTSTTQTQVSTSIQRHTKGVADTIDYTVSSKTYTFNSAVFPITYRANLLSAYSSAGFVQNLTIPAQSGTKTIPASMASGTYAVVLNYNYGSGTWAVGTEDGTLVDGGTFSSAPISYSIAVSKVA